jgi:hypothetical protein
MRPSRITLMLAGRPSVSNAAFVAGRPGSGSASTGPVVVVVVVLVLLVVVLLVVVLLVVVLLLVVVVLLVVVAIVVVVAVDGGEVVTSATDVGSLQAGATMIRPARRPARVARICTPSTVTGPSDSRGAGRRLVSEACDE